MKSNISSYSSGSFLRSSNVFLSISHRVSRMSRFPIESLFALHLKAIFRRNLLYTDCSGSLSPLFFGSQTGEAYVMIGRIYVLNSRKYTSTSVTWKARVKKFVRLLARRTASRVCSVKFIGKSRRNCRKCSENGHNNMINCHEYMMNCQN